MYSGIVHSVHHYTDVYCRGRYGMNTRIKKPPKLARCNAKQDNASEEQNLLYTTIPIFIAVARLRIKKPPTLTRCNAKQDNVTEEQDL